MERRGKVLISACLIGDPVRYDGTAKTVTDHLIDRLAAEGRLVPICPELAGGLSVPRLPAEIEPGGTAAQVLEGQSKIIESNGRDVSHAYVAGAEMALDLARSEHCIAALLMDGSPSCGSRTIHDGQFAGRKIAGRGVTAERLARAGLKVFAHDDLGGLAAFLAGED